MANKAFVDAYNAAAFELGELLKEQQRIEELILARRKTLTALATLIEQQDGRDKTLGGMVTELNDALNASLTSDIHKIITAAPHPLTASEIKDELNELGSSLGGHSNPLATIHAILSRLVESGRAKETVKDGKKAWVRYMTLSEHIAAGMKDGGGYVTLTQMLKDLLPEEMSR